MHHLLGGERATTEMLATVKAAFLAHPVFKTDDGMAPSEIQEQDAVEAFRVLCGSLKATQLQEVLQADAEELVPAIQLFDTNVCPCGKKDEVCRAVYALDVTLQDHNPANGTSLRLEDLLECCWRETHASAQCDGCGKETQKQRLTQVVGEPDLH